MRTVETFPNSVSELENCWIPLRDGTRLAARIWLPEGAEQNPVPALMECIPYRKRDITVERDAITHPYYAGHGYASLRVDMRGSGDSDGVLQDEYLKQEQDDGLEVLRWIAERPWCNGSIGMFGKSWGGFNSLQFAARGPRELKAIIAVCASDDRYADDIHYMGGCLLAENLSWATTMLGYTSLPPDPALVGERWREMWRERLEGSGFWLDSWLNHKRRDEYWKHGSVCEDYSAITCPVLAVSGWADGYSNAVFRLLSELDAPRMGLVGPWGHQYPHLGLPGPAIDFLKESLRWWDTWLKGVDTGIMNEPMLRVWMQDSVQPSLTYGSRPGRWVGEDAWPSPNIEDRRYYLTPGRIRAEPQANPEAKQSIRSPLSLGIFGGRWCSFSATPDLPHDQRLEDGGALVFEGAPLEEPMEILGAPVVELEVSVDKPVAMVAVRLSDVAPDDKATRITYGLLNLAHREGHEHPKPLTPNERFRVPVRLNEIGQVVPQGHRLRVSVSTSYWPIAWPPPEPVRLTVFTGRSSLSLPIRPRQPADEKLAAIGEPEGASYPATTMLAPADYKWNVIRDLASDITTLEVVKDEGAFRIDAHGMEVERKTTERYSNRYGDFNSVRGEVLATLALRRGDWSVKTVIRTILTSTKEQFRIYADLDAYEGDRRIHCHTWDTTTPRELT